LSFELPPLVTHDHRASCCLSDSRAANSRPPLATSMPASYCVQYAASNRSTCKMCKTKIDAGALRVGTITAGPGDYDMTSWRHLACNKQPKGLTEAELGGLDALRPPDQQAVRDWLTAAAASPAKKRSADELQAVVELNPKKVLHLLWLNLRWLYLPWLYLLWLYLLCYILCCPRPREPEPRVIDHRPEAAPRQRPSPRPRPPAPDEGGRAKNPNPSPNPNPNPNPNPYPCPNPNSNPNPSPNPNPNSHQMKVAELKKALQQHGLKPEGGKTAMAAALSEVEPNPTLTLTLS
jgi:hypothetical protein